MPGPIIHWDECRPHPVQQGSLDAVWTNLGAACGTVDVGLRREQIAAGKRSLPPHRHTAEEEIFYVLGGSGLSWQDDQTYEVRAGDSLLHSPGGSAHALVAGADGLDVLAFGDRVRLESSQLPRAKVAWLGPTWVEVGNGDHPWARDEAAGELELAAPQERPRHIINLAEVPELEFTHGDSVRLKQRNIGLALGSRTTGMQHIVLPAGTTGFPPHCHSAEEELFVVLDGDGQFLMQPPGGEGWRPQEHAVRRGSVISMPAGTGVAHAFAAGPQGLTYLAYGQRQPHDTRWYPRSRKVWFKGLGVIGRLEPLPYWDGED